MTEPDDAGADEPGSTSTDGEAVAAPVRPTRRRRIVRAILRGFAVLLALFAIGAVVLWRWAVGFTESRRCENHAPPAAIGDAKWNAAVATAHPVATDAAAGVLADGGNAVDAAIAAALALAVAEPSGSGLGGGGFALVHDPKSGKTTALDFRERAPAELDRAKLSAAARQNAEVTRDGALGVAIPSEWSGLVELHRRFGTLPMSRLARPAIEAAERGVVVSTIYMMRCLTRMSALRRGEDARGIFLGSAGLCPRAGWTLRQPDLARTLRRLTDDGAAPDAWKRVVAEPVVRWLSDHGSSAGPKDLVDPVPVERPTVSGTFGGRRVVSMGPPSSGGIVVIGWLQAYERARRRLPEASWLHVWTETSRLAFYDRATLLGDPDFVEVPTARLVSAEYADAQAARVKARGEVALAQPPAPSEGPHTSHVSVVDAGGMAVSMTLSLNLPFGSGLVVPHTGILLNDEMDDFYIDRPNAYGLVGNELNAPAPGKKPLSSMTPALVFDEQGLYAVIGSQGGSRIPTAVAWVLRELLEAGTEPGAAVHSPRAHHQWMPAHLELEPAFPKDLVSQDLGHVEKTRRPMGNLQLVVRTERGWRGVSDCREEGKSWSGQAPVPARAAGESP